MMKCIEQLVRYSECTIGNHSVRKSLLGSATLWQDSTNEKQAVRCDRVFSYHGNNICLVDDENKKFYLSHARWFTPSTNRALNDYRTYFNFIGYENVWNPPIYAYEHKARK